MTFNEFFKEIGMTDSVFGQFAYILDAPDEIFNAVKNDMAAAVEQEFNVETLIKEVSPEDDIDLKEIKTDIIDTYDLFEEFFSSEENTTQLPKDRVEFFMDLIRVIRDRCLELPERKVVEIIYEKITEDAILPTYAHNTDAGADIYANEDVEIPGGETKLVGTGIKVAIPIGWELQIRPRSGMSVKTPIRIANAPGTIDSGYRDEVKVICHNTSNNSFIIHKGERIAQFVPKICPMISWKEGKVSEVAGDRKGGFGSSGK